VELVRQALVTAGQDAEPRPPARFFTDASVLAGLLATDGGDGGAAGMPVPTVILGPGEPDQCHVVDEWCSASRVEAAVEVYSALLESWCTGRR
jgi:succinyl-diaminopimelate desuccinylase